MQSSVVREKRDTGGGGEGSWEADRCKGRPAQLDNAMVRLRPSGIRVQVAPITAMYSRLRGSTQGHGTLVELHYGWAPNYPN